MRIVFTLLALVSLSSAVFAQPHFVRSNVSRQLDEAFRGAPTTALPRARLGKADGHLVAVLAEIGLYPSRGRAKKDIPDGAVSVNNTPIRDADYGLTEKDLLDGGFIILRKGKKTYHVLRVADT